MKKILFLGIPFLLGNVYFVSVLRRFYRQTFICKLLPAVFTAFFRMLFSSLFSKKSNKNMYFHISMLALIFETSTCLKAFHTVKLTGIYNEIASNSKMIFLAFLAYIMLKKRFSYMQIIGQCIIFVGICWSGYNTNAQGEAFTMNSATSFFAIITSALMSSLGNIYFEKYIRKTVVDFHTYNMQYSFIYLFVSIFSTSIEIILSDKHKIIKTIADIKFYEYIIMAVLCTSMMTYISTKVEPIVRSFYLMIIGNTTYIIIDYIELNKIDTKALINLGIVNVGIIFYELKNIKKFVNKMMNENTTQNNETLEE